MLERPKPCPRAAPVVPPLRDPRTCLGGEHPEAQVFGCWNFGLRSLTFRFSAAIIVNLGAIKQGEELQPARVALIFGSGFDLDYY